MIIQSGWLSQLKYILLCSVFQGQRRKLDMHTSLCSIFQAHFSAQPRPGHQHTDPSAHRITEHIIELCDAKSRNILGRFNCHRHHKGNQQHPLLLKPPIQSRSKWNEQPDVIDDPPLSQIALSKTSQRRKIEQSSFLHPLTRETSMFHKE